MKERCVGCTLRCLVAANTVRPQHTGMCWTQPTGRPVQTQQQHTKHLIYPAHINLARKGKHLSQTASECIHKILQMFASVRMCWLDASSAPLHTATVRHYHVTLLTVHMPGKGKTTVVKLNGLTLSWIQLKHFIPDN